LKVYVFKLNIDLTGHEIKTKKLYKEGIERKHEANRKDMKKLFCNVVNMFA